MFLVKDGLTRDSLSVARLLFKSVKGRIFARSANNALLYALKMRLRDILLGFDFVAHHQRQLRHREQYG
jgi:hypothetical protein